MEQFTFNPARVHPAYRKVLKKRSFPVGPFIACLIIVFGSFLVLNVTRSSSRSYVAGNDPGYAFIAKTMRPVQGIADAIALGNAKTLARVSQFKRWFAGGATIGHRPQRKPARRHKAVPNIRAAVAPKAHAVIAPERARTALPAQSAPAGESAVSQLALAAPRTPVHRSPSYITYDIFASPQSAYGIFGYGIRVGSGVAQVNVLARAIGEDRGIMLTGLAWQRHSDTTGSTLTIGDADTIRGQYEESLRFDGVQYAGRNISYAVGWERTDFGDSAMHFGSFVTQLTASKPLGRRVLGEAHIFADSNTALVGVGGTWNTPAMGLIRLGIAPERGRGVTGFFGYTYSSPRMRISLEDRVWGAQPFAAGEFAPENYRQLRGTLEYRTSRTASVRLGYGSQTQGGFPTRTMTLGFIEHVDGAELHVALASSSAGSRRNAGLATYLSLPLGTGRTITEQNSLQGGTASSNVVFRQDVPSSGTGTGYALSFGRNGASFTDATVTSQTPGSTTRVDLSHAGPRVNWNSEFSGSILLFDGKAYAANQVIDQSAASDVFKGRGEASLTILTDTGKALPVGSIVRVLGESGEWRVDESGRVDIVDIATGPQTLIVTLPHGTCLIGIVMPPNVQSSSYDLGKQVCVRY